MKELSIEEKAKAYDWAIKRVEDIVGGKCPKPFVFTEGLFDYIFPELKESDDKKVRKTLIKFFEDWHTTNSHCYGVPLPKILSWLEKQDEPNPYSGVSFKYNGHTWGMCARDNGVEILVDGEIKERVFLDSKPQGKSALEAINEEKVDNANKVEPRQEKLTEFEKAVKQVMEEAIECGDTHNLKADADMLLSLVHKSAWSEEDEAIKQAKKCPYYGCAGTRICTYYSWTTHCPYPSCDKEDLFYGGTVYEHFNDK
jgi:hypothetical protein